MAQDEVWLEITVIEPNLYKKASIESYQDTACLGLVHGDDPQRCYGEGGGRGVHVWERM